LTEEGGEAGASRISDVNTYAFATLEILLARLQQSLTGAPFSQADLPEELRSRWVTGDGLHLIQVFPAEDIRSNEFLERFTEDVRSVAATAIGDPVVGFEAGRSVARMLFLGLSGAVLFAAVGAALSARRIIIVPRTAFLLFACAAWTLAGMVLFGVPLNLLSVAAFPVLFFLAVIASLVPGERDGGGAQNWGLLPLCILFLASIPFTTLGHDGVAALARTLSLGIVVVFLVTALWQPGDGGNTRKRVKGREHDLTR
jgi:hypothetical protein